MDVVFIMIFVPLGVTLIVAWIFMDDICSLVEGAKRQRRLVEWQRQNARSLQEFYEEYEKYPHIYGRMVNDQFYPQAPVPVRRRRNQTW